jgi:serine/threonine protein kinase
MDFRPGEVIAGKYRYENVIGRGATGTVVAATHLVLGQRVALKILAEGAPADVVARFVREARLAARLKSEHVVRVLDAGELETGAPYIAMELVEGKDLGTLLRARGRMPVREACAYVVQACEGLAEAHALGMVHRDVKLSNLFLSTRAGAPPTVKILDFGITKAAPGASSVVHATEADALLGTPRSMAPEQILSSRDVDARADVWALGVVLYTLLTGSPPFDGATLRELFEAILERPPRPIEPALPDGLAAVIDRCLRKNREERFARAREVGVALAPFARAARSRRSRVPIAIVAVALASTISGAAAVLAVRSRLAARSVAVDAEAGPREPTPTLPVQPPTVDRVTSSAPLDAATAPPSASPSIAPSAVRATAPPRRRTVKPKERWIADFVRSYPQIFCTDAKPCYGATSTEDECRAMVKPMAQSCANEVLPTVPDDVDHSDPRAPPIARRLNECLFRRYEARTHCHVTLIQE